ncbi:SGNH/GDSL hydrolase family protein [Reyranella soli]|uniref:AlgX/AlgJ SGNH hydrolase-like domain-containing protein n=1 Tax=Reyranella soli TaxID=1230389 RepID=A0A512N4Q5_9HYPH|nr:SGNH/GDSL hydrolase family protein [Reyranella soli]GEP53964.1 hypothetical protein RSO01_11300 [Reyranella soli]
MKAHRFFWPLYILLLLSAALAGSEAIASFIVPSWPARDMRPIEVSSTPQVTYNDWALRDRQRSFERPADVRFRSILVGDSFLEGNFLRAPLSAFVEQRLAAAGQTDTEAINFGISATGPRHYYYRIKNVALALKPDAIVLAFYAGNDFVSTPFGGWMRPPIAELPLPSLLAGPAPRTTWLAVNRLGLSEFGRNNKFIDGEFARLNEWVDLPADQRLDRIARHLRQNYYPRLSEATIREILSRGDGRFWTAFDRPEPNRELLAGWLLSGMIDWETGTWKMPRDAEEADRLYGTDMVDETLSWLVAADRLAKENGVQLAVALIPVGTGDPRYVDFWRLWPKYFSTSLSADARHRRLAVKLRQTAVPFFDLRDDLAGVPDTYRLTDGHWTERGMEIVAGRITRELLKMRRN